MISFVYDALRAGQLCLDLKASQLSALQGPLPSHHRGGEEGRESLSLKRWSTTRRSRVGRCGAGWSW